MGDTQQQSPERDCRRSRTKIPVRGSIYRGLRKAHFSPNEWFNNFQLRTTRLLLVIPFLNPNSTVSTIRICASICKNPWYMNGGLSGIWNVRFCFFGFFFFPPTCPMLWAGTSCFPFLALMKNPLIPRSTLFHRHVQTRYQRINETFFPKYNSLANEATMESRGKGYPGQYN